jgi:hypothetical protein
VSMCITQELLITASLEQYNFIYSHQFVTLTLIPVTCSNPQF